MTTVPLRYEGEGEFRSPPGHVKRCDKEFVVGEVMVWEPAAQRSKRSHDHYFAVIEEAWGSLPEALAMELPSAKHLRKFALIKAGYCTISKFAFRTNADAMAAAHHFTLLDSYQVVEVVETVVTIWRAQSQRYHAMGKAKFKKSKDDVLTVISQLIGADVTAKKDLAA